MARPLFDESKCIVCGCTDSHACEEGCEWIFARPPVCSQCVAKLFLAKLWGMLFMMEGSAKGELARVIRDVRSLYGLISAERASVLGIPTLRQVTQINRNERKWHEKNPPPPPV